MSGPIISLSGVTKHYGRFQALQPTDLDIKAGEFFSLLGPSGCGKTTLLRTIAGFETPSGGEVRIDGADMAGVPPNRRPTNMVFQSYAIFPHLSVAENVGFGLRRSSQSKAEKAAAVEEALGMVGLDGYGPRPTHAMSGGQRQRVALARALILKPKVLLLDEPLSALDKKLREQMQGELRRLQRQVGITFILVTHDQEEALIMSDRIAVMFEGQIAQLATPEVLYRQPDTRQVADFIGVMNFLPARITNGQADIAGLGRVELSGQANGDVVVGLRPETLQLYYDGDAAAGRVVEGEVAEVTYYGDMTYYDVRFDGVDTPVTISMKNLAGRGGVERGARARVGWDPRALVVFRD